MKQLTRIKDRYEETIMKKAHVAGVGIGYKTLNGRKGDQRCIVVLVEKKLPLSKLRKNDVVDTELDGIPTDVVEIGKVKALNQPEKKRTEKWRPAPGGVSIGHHEITAGTLGITVIDKKSGEPLILSNNHVLANSNDAVTGDPILQPGPYDGGKEEDKIAELHRFIPISFSIDLPTCSVARKVANTTNSVFRAAGSHHRVVPVRLSDSMNVVDRAVAIPVEKGIVKNEIIDLGMVKGTRTAELNDFVQKSGRTTCYTAGVVEAVDVTINVMYSITKMATFSHQVMTSALSQGGDSGSVFVSGEEVVGLLFAGSDKVSMFNPIDAVLDALNIEIPGEKKRGN